jgi:DNA-binding NarL/FixJ family response regulator
MKLEITVPAKALKQSLVSQLEDSLYENYDAAVLKAAKVPPIKTLLAHVMADEKYMAVLHKELQETLSSWVEDYLDDSLYDIDMPIGCYMDACEKLNEEQHRVSYAEETAEQEAEQIKRTIKALKLAGYDVVKR